MLAKLRTALPGFIALQLFIKRFARTTQVIGILKNKGLDQISYEQCYQLSETMPKNYPVKKHLQKWLRQHLDIQNQLSDLPLLVSSDQETPGFFDTIGRSQKAGKNSLGNGLISTA